MAGGHEARQLCRYQRGQRDGARGDDRGDGFRRAGRRGHDGGAGGAAAQDDAKAADVRRGQRQEPTIAGLPGQARRLRSERRAEQWALERQQARCAGAA